MDKLDKIIQLMGAFGLLLTAAVPVVTALAAFLGGVWANKKTTLDSKATKVQAALQNGANVVNTLAHYGMSVQEAVDHEKVTLVTKDTPIK